MPAAKCFVLVLLLFHYFTTNCLNIKEMIIVNKEIALSLHIITTSDNNKNSCTYKIKENQ